MALVGLHFCMDWNTKIQIEQNFSDQFITSYILTPKDFLVSRSLLHCFDLCLSAWITWFFVQIALSQNRDVISVTFVINNNLQYAVQRTFYTFTRTSMRIALWTNYCVSFSKHVIKSLLPCYHHALLRCLWTVISAFLASSQSEYTLTSRHQ